MGLGHPPMLPYVWNPSIELSWACRHRGPESITARINKVMGPFAWATRTIVQVHLFIPLSVLSAVFAGRVSDSAYEIIFTNCITPSRQNAMASRRLLGNCLSGDVEKSG